MGPRSALSIDNDLDPVENVKFLTGTLVRLHGVETPLDQCQIVSQQYGGVWPDASDQ